MGNPDRPTPRGIILGPRLSNLLYNGGSHGSRTLKEDTEWLHAARNGDQKAFRRLVEKYESRVAATVIGMVGRGDEAEDIGQETFIRFYRSLHAFREESGVGTYLTRIAINLCLDALKRRNRHLSRASPRSEEDLATAAAREEKPRLEAREIVRQGLARLDDKFRAVVVLRMLLGHSTRETARILGLPVGTVLSRLARAQRKLKDILTPLYGGNP